jgi:ubiquinone/menaquinone biosynthesis C-methylase UbiE
MAAWPLTLVVLGGLALLGAGLYWELIVAEGAHLGPWAVIWLYDLVALRYEQIKKFQRDLDDAYLGGPLAVALAAVDTPCVLDVAAGTGRGARSLLRQVAFDGAMFNVELSARMLAEGRRLTALWPGRTRWVRGPADRLPFPAEAFDIVLCLEALEFFPDSHAALAECVRVLRPGGWLVITNRVGLWAALMVGQTFTRAAFRRLLEQFPLEAVRVEPWQVEYDLARGRKKRNSDGPEAGRL